MRPIATLALLLSLLVVAAPLAAAGGKAHERGSDRELPEAAEHRQHRDNETDDKRGERHADDGNETKANQTEKAAKRAAFLEAFRAKLAEWRAAWKENATAIREACHAVEPDHENATKEEHRAWAHCIRDGYKGFWEALRLERSLWRGGWKHSDG